MSGQPRFVFRGLTYDRDTNIQECGIVARSPKARLSIRDQVNYYQTQEGTQFISTSKSFLAAAYYATEHGTRDGRIVKIDLEKVESFVKVHDLSEQHSANSNGLQVGSSLFNFAVRHREILIEGTISPEAIVKVFRMPQCDFGRNVSLDDFTGKCTDYFESIATKAYGAHGFLFDAADKLCHLGLSCVLAGTCQRIAAELPEGCRLCTKCLHGGVQAVEEEQNNDAPQPRTPMRRSNVSSGSTDLTPPPPSAPARTTTRSTSKQWYRTHKGAKYHVDKECFGLQKAKEVIPVSSKPAGLEPCKLCCQ